MILHEIWILILINIVLVIWCYKRIQKEANARHRTLIIKFEEIDEDFEVVEQKIHDLDMQFLKLQARFEERARWDVKIYRNQEVERKK